MKLIKEATQGQGDQLILSKFSMFFFKCGYPSPALWIVSGHLEPKFNLGQENNYLEIVNIIILLITLITLQAT